MKDTIYRENAIKAIEDKRCWLTLASQHGDMGRVLWDEYYIKFEDAIEALLLIPSADRPQGEWIRTGRTNVYGGIEVQCSNCGDKVMVQHLEDEWYCRHCGADMGMKGADDD